MGYRGQIDKQNRARDLRAQGWTLAEICEAVGCSKASASLWCRDVEIDELLYETRRTSRGAERRHGLGRRAPNRLQQRKQREIDEMGSLGASMVGDLSDRDLLVAGAALYAGEGAKADGCVKFANSDPRMIALFLSWFRRYFDIDESRLRFRLYLHEGLDLGEAHEFWARVTDIPLSQFGAPYRAVADPSIRRSKHPMGCASVVYSCTRTHRTIVGMMDALLGCRVPGAVGDPSSQQIDPG